MANRIIYESIPCHRRRARVWGPIMGQYGRFANRPSWGNTGGSRTAHHGAIRAVREPPIRAIRAVREPPIMGQYGRFANRPSWGNTGGSRTAHHGAIRAVREPPIRAIRAVREPPLMGQYGRFVNRPSWGNTGGSRTARTVIVSGASQCTPTRCSSSMIVRAWGQIGG